MARKSKQDSAARRDEARPGAPASTGTVLDRARAALDQGNVRKARQLAAEVALSGTPVERAEAQALLERSSSDRRALLTIAAVLLLIVVAAWMAILRVH